MMHLVKIFVLIGICTALGTAFVVRPMPTRNIQRIIVDVDAGIDDYQALVFLLNADARQEIKIEAIILSDGNAKLEHVKQNVQRLLNIVGRNDIPQYVGASTVLSGNKQPDDWFGVDGFGNLDLPPVIPMVRAATAPVAIDGITKQFSNQVTYIALGPLTNLALTIRLFPAFLNNVKEIVVMGGNDEETQNAEFNFLNDPEAVDIVFKSDNAKITLLTFQACSHEDMSNDWRWNLQINPNPVWNLCDKAERNLPNLNTTNNLYNSCDPLSVATHLMPSLRTGEHKTRAEIETCGDDRGRITQVEEGIENIVVIEDFNTDEYQKYFIQQFNDVCRLHMCRDFNM